jgi:hypothetical protein
MTGLTLPPLTTQRPTVTTTKAHTVRLHPTAEQAAYLCRACGTRRVISNWGLAEWQRRYHAGAPPSALALKKPCKGIRETPFPWTYDVTLCPAEVGRFLVPPAGATHHLAAARRSSAVPKR